MKALVRRSVALERLSEADDAAVSSLHDPLDSGV